MYVPIGVADVDMTEVGCQLWQLPFYVHPRPIPFDQLAGCKRMPKIIKPRSSPDPLPRHRRPQACSTGYPRECTTCIPTIKSLTIVGDEKCIGLTTLTDFVASWRVLSQRIPRSTLTWDVPRLAKHRSAD